LNRGLDPSTPAGAAADQSQEDQGEAHLAPDENGVAMAHKPWPEKKPMMPQGVQDIA
jgi:hypothetical protein